jgi:dihydroorotase
MNEGRFGLLTDAPAGFVLLGARVIDPSDGSDGTRDLVVRDGRIAAPEAGDGLERIDARRLVVAPGFCDLHAHLREPGSDGAESVASGTRAAAHGGFTTVCAMPNTDPPLDDVSLVAALATREGSARVRVIAAATHARAGERLTDLRRLAEAGAVAFSDDGVAAPGRSDLFGELAALDRPLVQHAEDGSMAAGAVMRAGAAATRLGLSGWPAEAEATVVERDIGLAEASRTHLHLTHLSTAASVALVRDAKERGVRLTADVTPHHLAMTDAWVAGSRRFSWEEPDPRADLAYEGSCRVNPPLPARDDAGALLDGLADGTIDAVATDHAPHPPERKLVPFDDAAPGLIGLETALSLGLAAVEAGRLRLATLIAALSTRPAAVIGERRGLGSGEVADLVAFEPDARWTVERSSLASASANTPLLGMELPGVVRLTVADGRVTWRA